MSTRFALDAAAILLAQGHAKDLVLRDNAPASLVLALTDDGPLPEQTLVLDPGELSFGEDQRVVFGGADIGSVRFDAKASGGLVISTESSEVLSRIALADPLGEGFTLPASDDDRYLALYWGYDIDASAKGGIGLGAVNLTFGADGRSTGTFAVIRRLPKATAARESLSALARTWRLPRQVEGPADLPPGSWLIGDVDGSLGLQLGVGYSYGMNWLRDTAVGGLRGNIGLRVEAGLQASLGFTMAGRYALVVDRASTDPDDQAIRLRLFRQRVKGWRFALDAGITARADAGPFAQSSLEGLIRGVFGIHAEQLLDDLDRFLAADPQTLLTSPVKAFLERVTGEVFGDAVDVVEGARDRLKDLLVRVRALRELAPSVVERLWTRLSDRDDVEAVRTLAQRILDLEDPEAIRAFVRSRVERLDFLKGPEGAWLTAAVGDRLVDLLQGNEAIDRLVMLARRTLDILDGGAVQQLIGRLRQEIDAVFHLDAVEQSLDKAIALSDPVAKLAALDDWLVSRFEAFLDSTGVVGHLRDLQGAIDSVRSRGEAIYQKTLAAVQQQVEVHLTATYQKERQDTALLDLVFDFAPRGRALAAASAAQLQALLGDAIRGRFDRVLTEQVPGLRIGIATLSHEVTRQRRIDVTFPFGWRTVESVNRGFARMSVIDDDGRVLLYEAEGSDDVAVSTAKARRDSTLSIMASLPMVVDGVGRTNADEAVRLHRHTRLQFSYGFHESVRDMGRAQLEQQLRPWVEEFFPHRFPTDGPEGISGSFEHWILGVDAAVEDALDNGLGNLGNSLISLEVGVPDRVGEAWLEAPAEGDPAYIHMSLGLQATLRKLIAATYFADVRRYGTNGGFALLAYLALPPMADADLHWDFVDPSTFRSAVGSQAWHVALEGLRFDILRMVQSTQGGAHLVSEYRTAAGVASRARGVAFTSSGQIRPQINSLLVSEKRMIKAAARAGARMAAFRAAATDDLSDARRSLADFAADLTRAFNGLLRNRYVKDSLRPLGSLLYSAAARAFDPSLELDTSAILRLSFLRPDDADFPPPGFPPQHPAQSPDSPVVNQQLLVD